MEFWNWHPFGSSICGLATSFLERSLIYRGREGKKAACGASSPMDGYHTRGAESYRPILLVNSQATPSRSAPLIGVSGCLSTLYMIAFPGDWSDSLTFRAWASRPTKSCQWSRWATPAEWRSIGFRAQQGGVITWMTLCYVSAFRCSPCMGN